jgi:tRNA(fMet)-specific endonuclease VapC
VYVLDSNTVSYYMRGDPEVTAPLERLQPANVAVPAIVEYELRYGMYRLPETVAKSKIRALESFLMPIAVLLFDSRCADQAARLRATLEAAGTPIGPHDVLIAATALRHQATLVTRNVREFSRVPALQWENWHEEPGSA